MSASSDSAQQHNTKPTSCDRSQNQASRAKPTMSTFEVAAKSAEPDSRENSPDQDDTADKRTSKKRKVLSCYACRSRKMKCDRVYPVCGRCQKTGRAGQCSYDPRLLEEAQMQPGQPLTTNGGNTMFNMHDSGANDHYAKGEFSDALRWKMRMQERRIEMLEQKLAATANGNNKPSPSQLRGLTIKEPEIAEEMMFRGKGFKTQFHGTSSVMSMISQVRHQHDCPAIVANVDLCSTETYKLSHVRHWPSITPCPESRKTSKDFATEERS